MTGGSHFLVTADITVAIMTVDTCGVAGSCAGCCYSSNVLGIAVVTLHRIGSIVDITGTAQDIEGNCLLTGIIASKQRRSLVILQGISVAGGLGYHIAAAVAVDGNGKGSGAIHAIIGIQPVVAAGSSGCQVALIGRTVEGIGAGIDTAAQGKLCNAVAKGDGIAALGDGGLRAVIDILGSADGNIIAGRSNDHRRALHQLRSIGYQLVACVAGAFLYLCVQSVESLVAVDCVISSLCIAFRGLGFRLCNRLCNPTAEHKATGCLLCGSRHFDSIAAVDSLGRRYTLVYKGDCRLSSRAELNLNRTVAGSNHSKGIAALGNRSRTAGHLVTADIVAGLGGCGNGLTGQRNRTVIGIIGLSGDGIGRRTAGGAVITVGNRRIEQVKCQLRVVNKDVTGAGNGLHRIVTAQFPRIHRILFHPLDEHVLALHHAGRSPHIAGITPTDVHVQTDTRHVTAQVVLTARFLVGMIVTATFTVGGVATAGVFAVRGGTKHHHIVFIVAAKTFAVRPSMFAVKRAVPRRTDRLAGIEGRDLAAAVFAVGILIHRLGRAVAGNVAMRAFHQALQFLIQFAGRHRGDRG